MINLLPQEEKRQLRAARTNTLLLRYNLLLLASVAFLGLAVGVTYLFLSNTKTTAEQTLSQNNSRVGGFASVESQAKLFRSNLTTAKQILDREVTYTKTILAIAKVLPAGVVLQNLNLDAQTFGTETTLVAHARDYASALALKDSFEKSTIFSNVHFQSIAAAGDAQNPAYPVTVNLNVTIKKDVAK